MLNDQISPICAPYSKDLTIFNFSTYSGLCDSSHRHCEPQQGVVPILGQSQQLGNILESVGWSIPVQSGCGLTETQSKSQINNAVAHYSIYCIYMCQNEPNIKGWIKSQQLLELTKLLATCRSDLHRENAQQLLPMGNVKYYRLCAVKEVKEDGASVRSVAINLLCRLLGQAAHRTLHPTCGK